VNRLKVTAAVWVFVALAFLRAILSLFIGDVKQDFETGGSVSDLIDKGLITKDLRDTDLTSFTNIDKIVYKVYIRSSRFSSDLSKARFREFLYSIFFAALALTYVISEYNLQNNLPKNALRSLYFGFAFAILFLIFHVTDSIFLSRYFFESVFTTLKAVESYDSTSTSIRLLLAIATVFYCAYLIDRLRTKLRNEKMERIPNA
jgi:hypothetical protein